MSTDLNTSFNEQYMNINTKLKKRFMRKPNISEATNDFIALAIQCEHSEQPSFAGHSYVGAAKCEASKGNFLGEAEHYMAAGRQFMKAEKKLSALKFFSPDRENVEAAIGCYLQAFTKYPEKSPLRISIMLEIADGLISLNHKLEAVYYLEQGLEMIESHMMKLMCMCKLLNLQIDCGKYDLAFDTANAICDTILEIPEDKLLEVQVTRILLTLLIHPSEEDKPESLKKLLTHLLADCEDEGSRSLFGVDMKLQLQSLAVSVTAPERDGMVAVGDGLRQLLTARQADIVHEIINRHRTHV